MFISGWASYFAWSIILTIIYSYLYHPHSSDWLDFIFRYCSIICFHLLISGLLVAKRTFSVLKLSLWDKLLCWTKSHHLRFALLSLLVLSILLLERNLQRCWNYRFSLQLVTSSGSILGKYQFHYITFKNTESFISMNSK